MIPLIAVSEGLKQTWKTIRGVIFNNILNCATIPKKEAGGFKAS